MKNPLFYPTFIFLIVSWSGGIVNAQQESNSYVLAKATFNSMYENAIVKEWELEENNIYEVEFVFNNLKFEAEYNDKGEWMHTERGLEIDELPEQVGANFNSSSWTTWKIDEVEEIQSPEHKLLYELEVKLNGKKQYLYYQANGNLFTSTSDEIY